MKKMKIALLALVATCVLFEGCSDTHASETDKPKYLQPWHYPIIQIRDCDYIVVESGIINTVGFDYAHSLVHCADCRNPNHFTSNK